MRICTTFICILASLSSMLMPFANMHAHLFAPQVVIINTPANDAAGHETAPHLEFITRHGHVHFGHSHDEHEGSSNGVHSVIDFLLALIDGVAKAWSLQLFHWLPVIFSLAVLFLGGRLLAAFLRPPDTPPPPSQRRFRWRPPLRGPPVFAVMAH